MNDTRTLRQPVVVDFASTRYARIKPVAVSAVELRGDFWGPRFATNIDKTLPSQWDLLESTGRLNNFRRVSGDYDGPFEGIFFNDSDLYKWLEAASWVVARGPHALLEKRIDEGIALIERAQDEDGYIDSYFSVERKAERWSNLRDLHEMYCAGHLIQAAVAHHRATGKRRLLNVAIRFANLLCDRFGPEAEGKVEAIDGHEEIEMALVELARETGNDQYLALARFFIKARGHGLLAGGRFGDAYFQDDVPFEQMETLAGHAVRALYMSCGVTDLYLETGEAALLRRLETLWERLVAHRMYITGGVGARHDGESIGADFELPNGQAYTETCAAIGSMMWCHRMLAATGDARYADLFEWTLYNGMLPGWSLGGDAYYYVNPLEDDGGHRRQPWYYCACCPPNVARTIASLPGYVYGTDADSIYVQQYMESDARIDIHGRTVALRQRTRYPWDGAIEIAVDAQGEFALKLRVPGWVDGTAGFVTARDGVAAAARANAAIGVTANGQAIDATADAHGYIAVERLWQPGDVIHLTLPMALRAWQSHPKVPDNRGRIALSRGPLLYCVERADMPGVDLDELYVDPQWLEAEWRAEQLGGVVVLRGAAHKRAIDPDWTGALYRPLAEAADATLRNDATLIAIPYFAWHNRESGPMKVWLNYRGE
ncbi:glycoside hydrolase family 127 protein [Paraburkholderia sp. BR10937]|uniref:glycoside hydrolase family 127 protein n=1 Tax=Paraburkholderia sp. BR10937 TaxID=3236994 RepID=UPI0034D2BB62